MLTSWKFSLLLGAPSLALGLALGLPLADPAPTLAADDAATARAASTALPSTATAVEPGAPGCQKGPGGGCCGACQDKARRVEEGKAAPGGGCPCQRAKAARKGS